MTRRHWKQILAIWATGFGVLVAGLLFGGSTVAPCLGITPETRASCVAAWEAQRPWTDRLSETPGAYEVMFIVLVSAVLFATALVYRQARRHRGTTRSSDIARR